ncbi:MAG: tetratricopeptide repeat protein [Calditrichia bacterium]
MKRLSILIVLSTVLLFSCSKKEAAVIPMNDLDTPTLFQKGNELYAQGNINDAMRAYSIIYNNHPTSREYVDAAIGLSRCYNDMGQYDKGMDLLYNLVRENMVPTRVPEIYNEMAKYYEVNAGISSMSGVSDESKDFQKAIDYYQKSVNYPNSDDRQAKAYAQYRIGELYVNMLKFKEAILAFNATETSFPQTDWARKAGQRLQEMKQAVNTVLSEDRGSSVQQEALQLPTTPTTPADSQATPPVQ